MDGYSFEDWCANLLKINGFEDVEVTKASGDYGIDIIAKKESIRFAIQCKRFKKPLTNKSVQEANAGKAYYKCPIAAVMTNSTFTKAAKKLAEENGVILWDREYLIKLLQKKQK